MKLLTIRRNGFDHLGVKLTDTLVLDVTESLHTQPEANVPSCVMDVITGGDAALDMLRSYAERVGSASSSVYPEEDLVLGPCVSKPGKMICVGLNYRKHAVESRMPIPAYPVLFNKFSNALAGHGEDIPLPIRLSSEVDYEAELVIVIGKEAKYVEKSDALQYVFGYCNANDVSARDLQLRTTQWLLGKSCDKFSPLGPYLVTADEVGDPNALDIRTTVNGEVRQQSNTSDMIFTCDEIVSYISQHMTLFPGDIILTGTPEGVAFGYPEDQRTYLKHGDVVTIEIEKLGTLVNRMVDEVTD